jgi:hypothetical protein
MSNKSLMSLVDVAAELERALIESGGLITPELEQLLEVKDVHLPEKVDSHALVIDRMESIAAFYKAKAEFFLRLAKSAVNVADRCEANLKMAMQAMGADEIKGMDIRYRLVRSNPACVIEDEAKIDGGYKVTETITKVDKKRILEDLKIGVPVEGARLEQGYSLRQYPNTPGRKAVG